MIGYFIFYKINKFCRLFVDICSLLLSDCQIDWGCSSITFGIGNLKREWISYSKQEVYIRVAICLRHLYGHGCTIQPFIIVYKWGLFWGCCGKREGKFYDVLFEHNGINSLKKYLVMRDLLKSVLNFLWWKGMNYS